MPAERRPAGRLAFEIDLENRPERLVATCAPKGNPSERAPLDVRYAQAFTNPIWIMVGDEPIRDADSAEYGMRWNRPAAGDGGMNGPAGGPSGEREHVFAPIRRGASDLRRVREGKRP